MAEIPETTTSATSERNYLDEARELANRLTLNRVASKLKSDPAADLTDFLSKQLKKYPVFVDSLAKSARAKSQQNETVMNDAGKRHEPPGLPTSLLISPELPLEILHPLSSHLLELAFEGESVCAIDGLSDPLSKAFLGAINRRLSEAECLHELHGNFVLGLGPSVAVKISGSLDPDHISNLHYVNSRIPDMPAPQCLGAFRNGRLSYFFLTRVPGVTLESVWPNLSTSHKLSIQKQLNDIFKGLRSHAPELPSGQLNLGSFETGICKDTRRMQRVSDKPIRTEAEFNDFLCHAPGRTITPWVKMVRPCLKEDHRIVMTHGDFHPRNIMVSWERDQGSAPTAEGIRVSGIIDWELAGWYPEYWEFVKALNTINMRGPLCDWIEFLPTEAIGSYPMEYSIDCILGRWLG